MNIPLSFLLSALIAGCSARESSESTPPPRDSIADSSAPDQAPAAGSPMRTSATIYQLRSHPAGVAAEIVYSYTNTTGAPVYLVNCNGDVSPALQRERSGKWEDVWWPVMNQCLSAPVVIPAGGTYSDTLVLFVDRNHKDFYKELAASDGTARYRLVWHQALTSFDGNARPFGASVALKHRVSNPFVLMKP